MPHPVDRHDQPFLTAAAVAADLTAQEAVAQRWTQPSVLPRMSVGALACHLESQWRRALALLPQHTDLPTLESADAHYARADWVTATALDDPALADTATNAAAEAVDGPVTIAQQGCANLRAVRNLLDTGAAGEVVAIPWQGWSLRRDDFLLTRMVEIVVHIDDLALSVEVATPTVPEDAFGPVRELLARLAERRHGQSALVGALTRRERNRPISAF